MIIDSHAHYSHKLYRGKFTCLDQGENGFCLSEGDFRSLLQRMRQKGIAWCIEPSAGFITVEEQLAFVAEHRPYLRPALGVHPKRCSMPDWEDREKLREAVMSNDIVAIGETGLDYSVPPEKLDVPRQKRWFEYLIRLANERQLPLILHTRDADGDVLEILRQNRDILHGGVAHCFGGDYQTAMAYIDLGFALGIGGRLLRGDEQGRTLCDTVKRVPLTSILVETDAPYIRPDPADRDNGGPEWKKARNSSLILPAVIDKIARLREEPRAAVEEAIYRNTLRVFRLDEEQVG